MNLKTKKTQTKNSSSSPREGHKAGSSRSWSRGGHLVNSPGRGPSEGAAPWG